MITLEEIREKLDKSTNPLIFFDDDADGVCSFALIYKYLQKGHGVIIKSKPEIPADPYLRKIDEYDPDLVIILDKPMAQDEFLDGINCDIIWIDHHEPVNKEQKNIYYYNPVIENRYEPTSTICWRITNANSWIAMTGTIGDWHYDKGLAEQTQKDYPDLVKKKYDKAPDILFNTKIGTLVKIIAFNLKGKLSDVKAAMKIITRVEGPDEILYGTTAPGKFLLKRYKKMNLYYERLKVKAFKAADDSPFLMMVTPQPQYSFSSELSNEVLYKFPNKVIIVGRSSSGKTKCSVRTALDIDLRPVIERSVMGIGYGGGHDKACGICIDEESFDIFLDRFKAGILELL